MNICVGVNICQMTSIITQATIFVLPFGKENVVIISHTFSTLFLRYADRGKLNLLAIYMQTIEQNNA